MTTAGTPIRVLQLVNGEYWSGAERVQALLGTTADRERFEVRFLCLKDGQFFDRARALGLTVERELMHGRADLQAALRIARRVETQRIDLIHTHTVRTNLIGRLVGFMRRVPVVTHIHSPTLRETESLLKNRTNAGVDRLLRGKSSKYIAVSQSLGDELVRSGIPQDKVAVVPNGIEVWSFKPGVGRDAARHSLDERFANSLLVAMIGLFRPRKGAEVLIDAFRSVACTLPDCYLVMVGAASTETYLAELMARCQSGGIADRVLFTGFRGDVAELMSAFDVIALPSLYGEGTPMVLLESMAMALPVIASPVEGISEVIRDGETGMLAPVGRTDAWTRQLIVLLNDAALRERLGLAARRRVEAHYNAERMTRAVEDVYRQVLPKRRQRHVAIGNT